MSRGVFRGGCELSMALCTFTVCWWVGLCSYPTGCLAWGIQALEPVGWWEGPCLDAKMATSVRVHTDQYPLGPLLPVSLPHPTPNEPQLTPASPGDPPRLVGRSSPSSYGGTALCWVPVYMKTCARPPRVQSLFPPVLWSSCTQAPRAFKAKCSGGSSSWCQTLMLGSLTWGSGLSFLCENLCDIIIFQFVGHPPDGYRIYVAKAPLLPSLCGFFFVFEYKISFLVDASLFCWWLVSS